MVLTLIFSTVSAASATDFSTQASLYLDRYYANIYSEGNGDISIWFEVEATGEMDEIGALSIRLQQKSTSSSTWKTIKTYSYTNYSNMLVNDKDFYVSSVDYSGIDGYSYRAYVTVWAGNDGNGDSREILTETVVAE
ncbi:MAG: hypothetical protein AB7V48_10210 [Sedimentibacter sp.]